MRFFNRMRHLVTSTLSFLKSRLKTQALFVARFFSANSTRFLLAVAIGIATRAQRLLQNHERHFGTALKDLNHSSADIRNIVMNVTAVGFVILLILSLVISLITNRIMIAPALVPNSLAMRGYTSDVVAERVAAEISRIMLGTRTHRHKVAVASTVDEPDIQVPGQNFSINTVASVLSAAFGRRQPTVRITITEDGPKYLATINVEGGPYSGNIRHVTFERQDNTQTAVTEIAEAAMHIASPYIFAVYKQEEAYKRCKTLRSGNCDFSEVRSLFSELLRSPNVQDNRWALLGMSSLSAAEGNYSDSIAYCKRLISQNSSNGLAYASWGYALAGQRNFNEAIKKYSLAFHYGVHDPEIYNDYGIALMGLRNYSDAVPYFKKALALNSRISDIFDDYGNALSDQHHYHDAILAFRRALELDPQDFSAYFNWGNALAAKHQYSDAIMKYKRATLLNPNCEFAYSNWGEVLNILHNFHGAILEFDTAIKLDSRDADAYVGYGEALNGLRRYDEAIIQYTKATTLDKALAVAYANWADSLNSLQRYNDALTIVQHAIELKPDLAVAYTNRGDALLGLKQYVKAISNYREAARLAPKDKYAYVHWASALKHLHKYKEGNKIAAKAATLNGK